MKIAAANRLAGDQDELDLGIELPVERAVATSERLPIVALRMGHLCDALSRGYDVLGFDEAAGGDGGSSAAGAGADHGADLKLDSLACARGSRLVPAPYPTMKRRLPVYAKEWRQRLAAACAKRAALGPASLVLYDVTTLYVETPQG